MTQRSLAATARILATFAHAIVLMAGLVARGADSDPFVSSRPVAAQVVAVELQNPPPPPETVPTPARQSNLPAYDDTQLIGRALGRVQPPDPAAKALGPDEALLQSVGTTRFWGVSVSAWEAPAFCHRPLYFEDENLERHGRSCGIFQPAASAVHFAGRTAVWPYLAGAFPPHECIYTLGRERPGSCAAYRFYRPPVSACGALYEAAAITGLSFVVP